MSQLKTQNPKLKTTLLCLVLMAILAGCNLNPETPTPQPTAVGFVTVTPFASATGTIASTVMLTPTSTLTPYPTSTPITLTQPTITPPPSNTPPPSPTDTTIPPSDTPIPPPSDTPIPPPSDTPVPAAPPTNTPIPPPPPRPRPTPTEPRPHPHPTRPLDAPSPPLATTTPAPTVSAASAWLTASTAHYTFYYLPNTPAQRDLSNLENWAEQGLKIVSAKSEITPSVQMKIYLVPRIFWQSGAAYGEEILLSYPERNYTSVEVPIAIEHETTHALAALIVHPGNVGGLLGEGFAVWATGGHYHHEDLLALASTLTAENQNYYIPLTALRNDFYGAQHEIAYLEGGAYDQWLIDTYGLPKFKQYFDQPDNPQPILGKSNIQLENAWLAALKATPHTTADVRYVQLQVRYYDVMREYETNKDPDARYLPEPQPSDWTTAILSHFLDPANSPTNIALENKLIAAGNAIVARDMNTASALLDQVATAAANLGQVTSRLLYPRFCCKIPLTPSEYGNMTAPAAVGASSHFVKGACYKHGRRAHQGQVHRY